MDFNDITSRLTRIYSSIDKISSYEIDTHVNIRRISSGEIHITFDKGQEESDTANIVMAIIEHLAKLKDHLKNILREKGDDPTKIEREIDESLEIQLAIDLANAEKHGYPLRSERSKRSPRIRNVTYSLVVPPKRQFGINVRTGEIVDTDDCQISITAEIIDKDGNIICRLGKLVSGAMEKWEEIVSRYHFT